MPMFPVIVAKVDTGVVAEHLTAVIGLFGQLPYTIDIRFWDLSSKRKFWWCQISHESMHLRIGLCGVLGHVSKNNPAQMCLSFVAMSVAKLG